MHETVWVVTVQEGSVLDLVRVFVEKAQAERWANEETVRVYNERYRKYDHDPKRTLEAMTDYVSSRSEFYIEINECTVESPPVFEAMRPEEV